MRRKTAFPNYGGALDRIASDRLTNERVGRLCLVLSRAPHLRLESRSSEGCSVSRKTSACRAVLLGLAELLKTKLACAESLAARAWQNLGEIRDYLGQRLPRRTSRLRRAVLRAEAESLLVRVVEEFADVPLLAAPPRRLSRATAAKDIAAKKTLSMVAQADLDELRHLAPVVSPRRSRAGTPIHPLQAERLSRQGRCTIIFRKLVRPVPLMYPYERELVARLSGRKFALLSVRSRRKRRYAAGVDPQGRRDVALLVGRRARGPVSSRWNIRAWPTIYVLDATGVIRAKNPSIEGALDTLIDGLLEAGSDATGAAQRK